MYVYSVTARSDTSTVVTFLFIAFINSLAASKIIQDRSFFLFTKFSFFSKTLHPQLLYYLPVFIKILVKNFILLIIFKSKYKYVYSITVNF